LVLAATRRRRRRRRRRTTPTKSSSRVYEEPVYLWNWMSRRFHELETNRVHR
jgi:hypothetical protein